MRLVLTTIFCITLGAQAQADDKFSGIRRLDLRVQAGNVKVTGVDGDLATVKVNKKRYDERCRLSLEQRGDLLFVELASKNLFTAKCEADFEISIPKTVDLSFRNGSGNITVAGTSGAMAVETGSGKVDVKGRISAFRARTKSGVVRAEGLESPASVHTGSGHMHLVYEKVPVDGQLEIRSGSGDAEVLFPKHAKVRTSFSGGSLKNRLGDSKDARFTVSMKSGSGDLLVGRF